MKVRVKSSHKADEVSAVQKRYSRIVGKYVLFQEFAVSRLTSRNVNLAGQAAACLCMSSPKSTLSLSNGEPRHPSVSRENRPQSPLRHGRQDYPRPCDYFLHVSSSDPLIGSLLTILVGLAVVSVAPLSGAPSRPDQQGTSRPFADRL